MNASALPSLLVVGGGGLAREVAQCVVAINSVRPTFRLLGHLDDKPALLGKTIDGVPVLGPVDAVADHPDALVVVATGRPSDYFSRLRLTRRLALPDERYATIIHPAASLASTVTVGAGSMLMANVVATAAVTVGRHVAVMPGTVLTHDDLVHDHATLAAGALLAGGITVGLGAYIGAGCRLRENIRLGQWSLVGMGSVVTRDVPDRQVWYGVPARRTGLVEVPHDVGDAA